MGIEEHCVRLSDFGCTRIYKLLLTGEKMARGEWRDGDFGGECNVRKEFLLCLAEKGGYIYITSKRH